MKNGVARSPLFYVGDKYKLVSEIKSYFPTDIDCFIEPFVGGGSVFMNIKANHYLLNDIDKNVIALHKMLCSYVGNEQIFFDKFFRLVDKFRLSLSFKRNEVPQELKTQYPKTYFAHYNKDAYASLKSKYNQQKKKNPLYLYALLIYGFNRMLRFNSKGEFNLPVGDVDFNQNTFDALEDYFANVSPSHINWYSLDFRRFFSRLEIAHEDFVYLDPPYLISFSEYNKLWNEETEKALLKILDELNERNVRFAISNVTHYRGRTNHIFLDWSNKYNVHSIKSNYISFNDNSIKKFNEVLITNY